MGSITNSTKKLLNWIFGAEDAPKPPSRPPYTPLKAYLDSVYSTFRPDLGPDLGGKTRVPISIYLKSKATAHEYAGVFDSEFHFSGSLIKVAAMFAAFKLRSEARLLVEEMKSGHVTAATKKIFYDTLLPRLKIDNALPILLNANNTTKKPSFDEVLQITGDFTQPATLSIQFTGSPGSNFLNHLRQMIVPSNNCSAGECIVRLSYPYINSKLMEDGFFDRALWDKPTPQGIWLAGDYIEIAQPHPCFNANKKQTYIRLPTTNDCDQSNFCGSAQNTTSKHMANFFFKILLRQLVDAGSSQEMFDLLHEGQFGTPPMRERSFISRPTFCTVPLLFTVEGVKIGQGDIKPDPDRGNIQVRSEGIIIKWVIQDAAAREKWDKLNLTGDGVVCWQNVPNVNSFLDGVANILNLSISKFINQDPLP